MATYNKNELQYVQQMVEDSFTQFKLRVRHRSQPRTIRITQEGDSFYLTIRDKKHWVKCTQVPLYTSDHKFFFGVMPTGQGGRIWMLRCEPSGFTIHVNIIQPPVGMRMEAADIIKQFINKV